MFNHKSSRRRKHFLIDTNQQRKHRPKKNRNRILNIFTKILFLKKILKLFRARFILTFFTISMCGFILFTLFSPYFEIKKIEINRGTPNLNIEAVQSLLKPYYGENLIFLKKSELKQLLLTEFLEFRSIEIKENWPDTITLSIKLSPPAFTLFDIDSANFAVISSDGVILSEIADDSLPVLRLKNIKKPLKSGKKIMEKVWLEKIKNIKNLLSNQTKLTIKDILFLPTAQEAHFVTNKNIALWFDLRIDVEPQIRKLELGANRIGLYSKTIEHIDLRIPGQLFWK